MSVGKVINGLLKPFGCKLVRTNSENSGEQIDPLERNDVATLEKLWGDPAFRKKYLSPKRQLLYEVVFAEIQKTDLVGPNCKLLDVGCGPGFFPRLLKDKGFEGLISGCDFSEQAISLSTSLIPEGKFFQHDIYNPITERYDLIVCMEVLEHLLHPEKAIQNLVAAAPKLILTVPEGRKDSFRGHLNLWTKESFEVFLQKTLPQNQISVEEVQDNRNLMACIS